MTEKLTSDTHKTPSPDPLMDDSSVFFKDHIFSSRKSKGSTV